MPSFTQGAPGLHSERGTLVVAAIGDNRRDLDAPLVGVYPAEHAKEFDHVIAVANRIGLAGCRS